MQLATAPTPITPAYVLANAPALNGTTQTIAGYFTGSGKSGTFGEVVALPRCACPALLTDEIQVVGPVAGAEALGHRMEDDGTRFGDATITALIDASHGAVILRNAALAPATD